MTTQKHGADSNCEIEFCLVCEKIDNENYDI